MPTTKSNRNPFVIKSLFDFIIVLPFSRQAGYFFGLPFSFLPEGPLRRHENIFSKPSTRLTAFKLQKNQRLHFLKSSQLEEQHSCQVGKLKNTFKNHKKFLKIKIKSVGFFTNCFFLHFLTKK